LEQINSKNGKTHWHTNTQEDSEIQVGIACQSMNRFTIFVVDLIVNLKSLLNKWSKAIVFQSHNSKSNIEKRRIYSNREKARASKGKQPFWVKEVALLL
jgi:hypothetical protein